MSFYLAIVSPLDTPLYETSFTSSKPQTSTSSNASTSSFPSWSSFTSSTLNGDSGSSKDGEKERVGGNLGLIAAASAGATQGAAQGGMNGQGGTAVERHLCQMVAHASLDSVEEVMEGTGSLYLRSVDRHNQWTVSAFIATSVKFILLHDNKNDDGIRLFFLDLWELYVKTSLNPFHTVNTPIRSPIFDSKVRICAKRNL